MLDVAKLTNCELELLINVLNVAPLPSDRENISVYSSMLKTMNSEKLKRENRLKNARVPNTNTLKWSIYADPDVYISSDRRIIKARCIEDVSDRIWAKREYMPVVPEYEVKSQKEGYGLTLKGNILEKTEIIKIESVCATSYYIAEALKQIMQKSSKLFLSQEGGALYIKNTNCCYLVSACGFDEYYF